MVGVGTDVGVAVGMGGAVGVGADRGVRVGMSGAVGVGTDVGVAVGMGGVGGSGGDDGKGCMRVGFAVDVSSEVSAGERIGVVAISGEAVTVAWTTAAIVA